MSDTARPAETVSESVPARHETPDLAELRRLLAAASPLPWQWEPASGKSWPLGDESLVTTSGDPVLYGWGYDASGIDGTDADRALIAAAVNALPTLLDELDELRAEVGVRRDARKALAHMREARDNARAEVERLTAMVEAVREYAAARQANIDHGPLLSARKAAHDALLAALARLDEEPQP